MQITPYHARYFTEELTKHSVSDSPERLASVLADAKVDLNPHQIEAALFAVRSPFSQGSILADEVGLGKTIEAGILIAQKWAELKRNILIIVPASLRKQWNQELQDKFFLPSIVLDRQVYNEQIKNGTQNPFYQANNIVICSYHFAYNMEEKINQIPWNLVVIDEAHRLRNVYKKDNKIASGIKSALNNISKVLLTATPLQNSLLELYGLVSFIDEYRFGDVKSFKSQYSHITTDDIYQELRERLKPVCQRTLRRQVLEYIKYTNRHSITQKFTPTEEEQELYDWLLEYLQRDKLYAFSSRARQLITLVLLKLLASSTFAISGTLEGVIQRLEGLINKQNGNIDISENIAKDFEELDEIKEEWEEEELNNNNWTEEELEEAKLELEELKKYHDFAKSITRNAKADSLIPALKIGFERIQSLGANKKAVIFTESRRTQQYLLSILQESEYKDKVVLFNGSNDDELSKRIYFDWLQKNQGTDKITGSKQSDQRAAIVEYFRDSGEILLATEAAAEGINLQFCSLVVNYDLPWNPQRIEQRIGRCHRYGQMFDVVVVNFLNENNLADLRIYELLTEKFKLFDGVFGASDEILGSIESGIDFEKRIVQIFRECRTPIEIENAFDQLQNELSDQINSRLQSTRKKLLENFDEEVHEKLKMNMTLAQEYVSKFDSWLWQITKLQLRDYAQFDDEEHIFKLNLSPADIDIPIGNYYLGKTTNGGYAYRIQHPLAQYILQNIQNNTLPSAKISFQYSNQTTKITILDPLQNLSGILSLYKLNISGIENEDHLIFVGFTKDKQPLTHNQCMRLFSLSGTNLNSLKLNISNEVINELSQKADHEKKKILANISERNTNFFEEEIDKLDKWADDKRNSHRLKLKELDDKIKELKKSFRLASNLPEKLEIQKKSRNLELKRDEQWQEFDKYSKKIEQEKDQLIDNIQKRLEQSVNLKTIFTIEWELV